MNSMPSGAFSSSMPKEKVPSGYKKTALNVFTPEQYQLFQQLFPHLSQGGDLSRLASGDQSMFEKMERPAMRQFGELQGNLASRFSGMGMGARNSSGFQNTTNAAASDFAQQLQGNRLNLQRQALNDLMGLSNQLLGQRPQDIALQQKRPSFWQQLALQGAHGLGQGAGSMGGGL